MKQNEVKLSIIIVNYNTCKITKRCLKSVYKYLKNGKLSYEVIVVDNGSNDSSVNIIKNEFKDVILIENKINCGFSKANNQAIDTAKGEYILLLNSDTIIIEDSFTKLINIADKYKNIGVLGCKLLNFDGTIQSTSHVYPNLLSMFLRIINVAENKKLLAFLREKLNRYKKYISFLLGKTISTYLFDIQSGNMELREVDWVTGACFLIPKSVINDVGQLDERFFMYGEDVDWCKRINDYGYKIYHFNGTSIIHDTIRKNGIGLDKLSPVRVKSVFLYYRKHYNQYKIYILKIMLLFFFCIKYFIFFIQSLYKDRSNIDNKMQQYKNIIEISLRN